MRVLNLNCSVYSHSWSAAVGEIKFLLCRPIGNITADLADLSVKLTSVTFTKHFKQSLFISRWTVVSTVAAGGQQQLASPTSDLTASGESHDTTVGPAARCRLSPNTGSPSCGIPHSFSRWHHDLSAAMCVPFNYTGCGGNANNFRSEIECQTVCGGSDNSTGKTIQLYHEISYRDKHVHVPVLSRAVSPQIATRLAYRFAL